MKFINNTDLNGKIEVVSSDEEMTSKENSFEVIRNEIVLFFYSLEVLKIISNELISFKKCLTNATDDVEVLIQITDEPNNNNYDITDLKTRLVQIQSKIRELSRSILPSFIQLFDFYLASSEIIEKQKYLNNVNEQLNHFFQFKFEAFQIEIDSILEKMSLNLRKSSLKPLIDSLINVLIDCYELLFTVLIQEKLHFVNKCASFSQALTTLIASINLKFYKNPYLSDSEVKSNLEFHLKNGILVQFESLLSCSSNEQYMLAEHSSSIENFDNLHIHLPINHKDLIQNNNSNYLFNFSIENDGFHIYLYTNQNTPPFLLKQIKVYPILVNVGINEQAISSNILGDNLLQKFINTEAIVKLQNYYLKCQNDIKDEGTNQRLNYLLYKLKTNKSFINDSRPIELLHIVGECTRLMFGLRATNCKSGKDRTGVSVSLEQAQILLHETKLNPTLLQTILDDLRRNGTRIFIIEKNIGARRYAFNRIRYFLLPKLYKPPKDLCDDLQT
jgi:hypothetical protein